MNQPKTQRAKIGVAGELMNQLMGNNSTEPKVGEGATILMYSDRHAYEVVSVSDDGNKCTIRKMDAKYIGKCIGDESYEYSSNENGPTKDLEWNAKKGQWEVITYSIQLIKALSARLFKEHGHLMWDHIPGGLDADDLYEEDGRTMKLVKGITKSYRHAEKVSIIFGRTEEYNDPSF